MAKTALQILQADKENAARYAERASKAKARRMLERAQRELTQRLQQAEGLRGPGADSFTAAQMRATLAQVRAVLVPLTKDLRDGAVELGRETAEHGAQDALDYIGRAEQEYRGSTAPLPFDTASMLDRAIVGSDATVLRRLASDPANPARGGVLERYGMRTLGKFEDTLQQRLIQGKSWDSTKADLVADSPFLQGAPAYWTERILRTESMSAHNAAGQAVLTQVQDVVGEMLKILSATFDSRTGADSYAVHGQVRRANEPFHWWGGAYMHPPNRPNDREIVVPHHASWPIPASLKPLSDGAVAARWAAEERKGAMPPRPKMTTVDLAAGGQPLSESPPMAEAAPAVPVASPAPVGSHAFVEPTAEPVSVVASDYPRLSFNNDDGSRFADASHRLFKRTLPERDLLQLIGVANNTLPNTKPSTSVMSFPESRVIKTSTKWLRTDAEGTAFSDGELVRTFRPGADGKVKVSHDYFVLEDRAKGNGFGSKVLADQLDSYPKLGVSKVALSAAWDGPYVWARAGFHVSDDVEWDNMRNRFASFVKSQPGVSAEAADALSANVRTAQDIALSGHGERQLGKEFLRSYYDMNGHGVPMELHVGSPAYDSALAYFRSRSITKPDAPQ